MVAVKRKGGDYCCGCIGGVVVSKGNGRWGVLSGSGDGWVVVSVSGEVGSLLG